MSGKKRLLEPRPARRTGGEGVPKTQRQGPETAQSKAAPQRGTRAGTARVGVDRRTARDREGL
jgi:hypothetical protein